MHLARTYSYDTNYSGGQGLSHPDGSHFSTSAPHRDYSQQQASGHYYENTNDVKQHTSPMIPQAHRFPTSESEPRYYQPPGGSSSHLGQPGYHSQTSYYASRYSSPAQQQHSHHVGKHSHSAEAQFIPTPSEIAHAYTNYSSMSPQSPMSPPDHSYTNPQFPSSSPTIPSSRNARRPMRISSSRPPSSQSPSSPTSPSGERFPCEKCGKTFSRSHDRKRHHETQHMVSPVIHRCRYCEKEFSRADSLKRHLDNGCDEMPT